MKTAMKLLWINSYSFVRNQPYFVSISLIVKKVEEYEKYSFSKNVDVIINNN